MSHMSHTPSLFPAFVATAHSLTHLAVVDVDLDHAASFFGQAASVPSA
jgi:hypothetical protein